MKNNKICVSKKTLMWAGIIVIVLLVGIVVNTTIESLNKNKLVTNSKASGDGLEQSSWCYGIAGYDVSVTTSVKFLNQKGAISFCKDGCDPANGKCRGNNSSEVANVRATPFCGIGKKYCFDAKNYSLLSGITDRLQIRTFSIDCDEDAIYACESGVCADDGGCVPVPTPTIKDLEEQIDKDEKVLTPTPTDIVKIENFEGDGWLKITGKKLLDPSLYNPKFESAEITQASRAMTKQLKFYQDWYNKNVVDESKSTNFVALRQLEKGISFNILAGACHKGNVNDLFNFQNIDNNYILDQCQDYSFEYFQDFTSGKNPLYLKAIVDTVKKGEKYKPLYRETVTYMLLPGKNTDGSFRKFKLYVGPVVALDFIEDKNITPGSTINDYEKVMRSLYFSETDVDQ